MAPVAERVEAAAVACCVALHNTQPHDSLPLVYDKRTMEFQEHILILASSHTNPIHYGKPFKYLIDWILKRLAIIHCCSVLYSSTWLCVMYCRVVTINYNPLSYIQTVSQLFTKFRKLFFEIISMMVVGPWHNKFKYCFPSLISSISFWRNWNSHQL